MNNNKFLFQYYSFFGRIRAKPLDVRVLSFNVVDYNWLIIMVYFPQGDYLAREKLALYR